MKRGKVREVIFHKRYEWEDAEIPFGDLPKDLLPTDKIFYNSDPGYFSENESWYAFTEVKITRERDQTDEEYQKDVDWWAKKSEETRKTRYEQYLKLKKEFEIDEIVLKEQDNYPNTEDDGWMTDRNHRPD